MYKKEEIPVIEPKDIIIGNVDAPVTITEFIDYESEKCVQAHEIVKEVMQTFSGKINFNFRHFPLVKIHQRAHKAAEAAIGAAQEGKFLEMHETLLKNRRHLGTITLKSYAKEVGVTSKSFLNDLINSKYGWFVQDDLKHGIDLGVRDVPAFFINGEKFEGNITSKSLSRFISDALKKRKIKKAA
ncbi:thioredoxin domain-containing protein [Ginsengibacter hankyongi]|uniref:Thioredoxin domain-containing protein n=1 Tax=Ginsengibacter hankyongi TaxID=2607284 RepID=A0A5J5IJJ5_9BACT|nr:thioredoxin domain-containing protein [Ginsengibacter hankyongi]KAA9040941.1 thioredoxin domain-containing protein [Ginsengibacter hankyongi]